MPVYRYKQGGLNEDDLKDQVPTADASSLSAGNAAMERYFDITALTTSKDDLDTFMAGLGWTFDSTDPSTTPSEASETSSSGAGIQPQSHRSASADPTVNDDSNDGYAVGSYWVNTTTDKAFICLDATVGAAVWELLTPEAGDNPACEVYRTTGQTITTSWVAISFTTQRVENDSTVIEWAAGTPTRLTLKETGLYLVYFSVPTDGTGATSEDVRIACRLAKNGTAITGTKSESGNHFSATRGDWEGILVTGVFAVEATANDYVEVEIIRETATNSYTTDDDTVFGAVRMTGLIGPQGIAGSGSSITVKDSGVNVPNTPHTAIDFIGALAASDAGSGVAEISLVTGSEFDSAASEGESSTTSATYVQKLRLTTASVPAGDYYISWYYEHAMGGDDKQFGFRVQIDDTTTISEGIIECKGQYADSQWRSQSGMYVATLTATTHDIDLDYADVSGDTAYIRRARLAIWRVS